MVHESAPTCSVLETDDSITEAVQAKEKAGNKRFVCVFLFALRMYMFSVGFNFIYRFFMVS